MYSTDTSLSVFRLAWKSVRRAPDQAEAPLMKNHLSMELSIFSGGRFTLGGSGGSCSGEMRLGEGATVRLVLWQLRCVS